MAGVRKVSVVSDEILMEFMKEMRTDVKAIKDAVSMQAQEIATVKEVQRNHPKTTALWCAIGALVTIVVTLLISIQQIKKEDGENRQRKEQSAVPRDFKG